MNNFDYYFTNKDFNCYDLPKSKYRLFRSTKPKIDKEKNKKLKKISKESRKKNG